MSSAAIAKITYFKSASGFRRWLEVNQARVSEVWVGFFKKDSGKGGLTYARRIATGWVLSAKKPETRARRLGQLIAESRHRRRLGPAGGSNKKYSPRPEGSVEGVKTLESF